VCKDSVSCKEGVIIMKSEIDIRERLVKVKSAKEECVSEFNIDDMMINIGRQQILEWILSD